MGWSCLPEICGAIPTTQPNVYSSKETMKLLTNLVTSIHESDSIPTEILACYHRNRDSCMLS